MIFKIYREEDRHWVVALEGRLISKHPTFKEAKKIASLLSTDLCGDVRIKVVDSDTDSDQLEQELFMNIAQTN